jgi:hypothetical protein
MSTHQRRAGIALAKVLVLGLTLLSVSMHGWIAVQMWIHLFDDVHLLLRLPWLVNGTCCTILHLASASA